MDNADALKQSVMFFLELKDSQHTINTLVRDQILQAVKDHGYRQVPDIDVIAKNFHRLLLGY